MCPVHMFVQNVCVRVFLKCWGIVGYSGAGGRTRSCIRFVTDPMNVIGPYLAST